MNERSLFLREHALFEDRRDAGVALARSLARHRGENVLVLGIPRGGVPVAAEVARALEADLDVVVARKLGAPDSPELAIGAVTANGGRYLNDDIIAELGVPASYVERVTAEQRAEAQRRERRFRGPNAMSEMRGRTVIVVDDGLATGATMRAAVRSVRRRKPARLIAAVPVGAAESCAALRKEVDELVCPHERADFGAVGFYYRNFEPTEDDEVQRILRASYAERRPAAKAAG
ncbi:MAG: phosphoribosyltransferase family protein [Thermodesulfobacteriota bacterium]